MTKMIRWFKQFDWVAVMVIVMLAAFGGFVGALLPFFWFFHGVCT